MVINLFEAASWMTFKEAEKICHRCLDASLVQRENIAQLLPYLPLWIGLKSKKSILMVNNTENWFWLDGSSMKQSQIESVSSIHYPKHNPWIDQYPEHAMLAFPTDWSLDKTHYVGMIIDLDSEAKKRERTKMDWLAMPTHYPIQEYKYDLENNYNSSLTRVARAKLHYMRFVACQRPLRPACHFWNNTEEACLMNDRFGCHNYLNVMLHQADGAQSKLTNLHNLQKCKIYVRDTSHELSGYILYSKLTIQVFKFAYMLR